MRGAAPQPRDDPAPERPDLEARVAQTCADHQAVIGEIRAGLRLLAASQCDPQLAAMLADRLQLVAAGAFDAGIHLEEMRGALAEFTAANKGNDRLFESGRAFERAQIAKAAIPGPRHRRSSSREPGRGQLALIRLQGIAGAAALALQPLLRHALPHLRQAGQVAGHIFGHPATWKLAGHTGLKAAGVATAGTAAGGLLIAGAVVVTSPGASSAGSGHGHRAAPAASVYAATPIPSSSQVALSVVHPKARHAAKEKTLLAAPGVPVPLYSPYVPASSVSPSSSPSITASAGPAQIAVSTPSLDLSILTSVTFQVSASGNGWASWSVSTDGSDLDFSPSHGILQAGQSVTVTVKVDPAQLLDGNTEQSFTIGGQLVTVTLPGPVTVPSVDPAASVSVPPILPTASPS